MAGKVMTPVHAPMLHPISLLISCSQQPMCSSQWPPNLWALLSHSNSLHLLCSCHGEGMPTAAAAAFCVHPSLSDHCLIHTLNSFGILVGRKEKVRAKETNDSTKVFPWHVVNMQHKESFCSC